MWIGSWKNGIIHYDPNEGFKQFLFEDSLTSLNETYAIWEQQANNVWIGGQFGLHHFDGKNFDSYRDPEGLGKDSIYAIKWFEDNI